MKRSFGLLMVLGLVAGFGGCGGDSDSPTGPKEIKHGYYKVYGETGNLLDKDTYREGSCVESCEWRKTYGDGSGSSVQQTVDGGFIVSL